jgi:hypothetical protein
MSMIPIKREPSWKRSNATMNEKFESNSNNYDESNLNRLHSDWLLPLPVPDGERENSQRGQSPACPPFTREARWWARFALPTYAR